MSQPKKLIEVAMPIKEISAECIRDDRIQHGHISSLHKWWARRPLPVCRAVVFASLVPDPLDENCHQAFKDAVEVLLGKVYNAGDPYKPYDDIPFTAAIDKMEDNHRNRLLMFIGKFSNIYIQNEKTGKSTAAKDQLSHASLIKWDNKNNEDIIGKARKLIWVSYNASSGLDADTLIQQFNQHSSAISNAENALYITPNRHLHSDEIIAKEKILDDKINAFLDKMPKVFDPFAGGGAIPLEASRLGCRTSGNDINPVAHIIQRCSLEFPQKYGKPISYSKKEFIKSYGQKVWNNIPIENMVFENAEVIAANISNRLSFDVDYYIKKVLELCHKDIAYLYPSDAKGNTPIAYYWSRIGYCANPTCKAEVPLLRGFYIAKTKTKQVYLNPIIKAKKIEFEIVNGKYDETKLIGWNNRGNLKCPHCRNITDVKQIKQQNIDFGLGERLLAVIVAGEKGKEYRLPTDEEVNIIKNLNVNNRPNENMQRNSAGGDTFGWGVTKWGQLFTDRQLISLNTLVSNVNKTISEISGQSDDYKIALHSFLGIWVDRMASRMTRFGLIDLGGEKVVDLFGRQAIPMVFDYPEMNVFKLEQSSWIIRYINSEGSSFNSSKVYNSSSGEKNQFTLKSIDCVVTDPPYYDAMAYADLSDFFYIWLKRILGKVYPNNFSTPQTPKSDECTALKHHHAGSKQKANKHFESKLLQIFDAIEHQTSDIVSIMFAHQSTEAWSTLCNSILGARMNITGSWAIDTEKKGGLKENKAFLSSSVTVACRPTERNGVGEYKTVKNDIEKTVDRKVDELYQLGLRGADLLTACFGQAVSEFGQFEKVEKADGSEVTVAELLEMAKESAFNSLLKGFDGDDFTKFYIGWLQLFGFTESNFDDAAKFSRIGLNIDVSELFTHNILLKKGNKQELAGYKARLIANRRTGESGLGYMIDNVHRAMSLFAGTNRKELLEFISKVASSSDSLLWRVITSLCEVLPQESDDFKQANGLLLNKESLIRESKNIQKSKGTQGELF